MNQLPEKLGRHQREVRMIVDEGSSIFGNTVFFEDPTTQLHEMGHAVETGGSHNTTQYAQEVQTDAVIPNDASKNVPTPALPT